MIYLGIDASTTNIGYALFEDSDLQWTESHDFKKTYSVDKLKTIVEDVEDIITTYDPDVIILEEPITAKMPNTKSTSSLNQVAGAICAIAFLYNIEMHMLHNRTAKSAFGVTHKEMANILMINKHVVLMDKSDHECDAVLMVEAYLKING